MLREWETVASAVFLGIYAVVLAVGLALVLRKRRERFDQFSITMTRGLETGRIVSLQDCLDIARGISPGVDDGRMGGMVAQWLRQYMVKLISDQVSVSQAFECGPAKDRVSSFIREIEESDPYARLPAAERALVVDITRSIESNDISLARAKAHDLAAMIEARADHARKLERTNRWSIPLAVLGIVVSVFFGITSIH